MSGPVQVGVGVTFQTFDPTADLRSSAVPELVTTLAQLFAFTLLGAGLPTLDGDPTDVVVFDGPEAGYVEREVLIVGWSDGGINPVRETRERRRGPSARIRSTVEVDCILWAGSGHVDVQEIREHVAGVLALIEGALAVNRTLNGICSNLELGLALNWSPDQSGDGAIQLVGFTVEALVIL